MRHEQLRDDARSLALIGVSAFAGLVVTVGLVGASLREVEERRVVVRFERDLPVLERGDFTPVPLTGVGRLYGRVWTRDGEELSGFIRWDRNEGSWNDLLDANKDGRRGSTQSGIRFGHVQRIDVIGKSRADLLLRSGEVTRMQSRSTDLGSSLRALVVQDAAGGTVELEWSDLARVEFEEAPADLTPTAARLHGTLTLRDGMTFTGSIAWDTDEIYTGDVLDGDDENGRRQEIPFESIASISRNGSGSAQIVLHTGRQMILRGTNDVDSSIRGIAVSDPRLGEVKVDWDDFQNVSFHAPAPEAEPLLFDGGRRIRGTVVTRSGEELTGDVRWDDDERFTWEMLNGEAAGVEYQIEFGRIARITRAGRGVSVELLDGRTFELTGSNDVDPSNRGVVVETERGIRRLDWNDFVELRLER